VGLNLPSEKFVSETEARATAYRRVWLARVQPKCSRPGRSAAAAAAEACWWSPGKQLSTFLTNPVRAERDEGPSTRTASEMQADIL